METDSIQPPMREATPVSPALKENSALKYLPFNIQFSPIIFMLAVLAIIIILFRMKSIEQDYLYNDYLKKIEEASFANKELKARKAKLLSAHNLKNLAAKFHLEQPKEHQIIIIPD